MVWISKDFIGLLLYSASRNRLVTSLLLHCLAIVTFWQLSGESGLRVGPGSVHGREKYVCGSKQPEQNHLSTLEGNRLIGFAEIHTRYVYVDDDIQIFTRLRNYHENSAY